MALGLCGFGGFVVFCESGCALVADGAGDMWMLLHALFFCMCVGCGVIRELGDVLTLRFYRIIRVPS